MTQAARTPEPENLLEDAPQSEVRHSFIRDHSSVPGSDAVPSFLIRDSADRFVLPHLLVWSTLGLLAYGAVQAGASAYHFLSDPRVTPLSASRIRTELHAVLDEAARARPLESAHAARAQHMPTGEPAGELAYKVEGATVRAAALAFVPQSHVSLIKVNAAVYECRLWSMFACEPVGRVVRLLPGEVARTDKSGGRARGQYAVVQLTDPSAADAESLRIRDPLESRVRDAAQLPVLANEAGAQSLL